MTRHVSDVKRIMRLAIGRRNENDPDSSDTVLMQYIQDFINLTMSDDLKLFEQFGTLEFTIDNTVTDGVYTFNSVGASNQFANISSEGFITLTTPPAGSISWNELTITQDPGTFYRRWGINNEDILVPGYPTDLLYYGTQLVFRTIPDTSYDVKIYGYKIAAEFDTDPGAGDPTLPFDYWLRYLAYGSALNYARDYNFSADKKAQLQADLAHEKKLLLTRSHNQIKVSRAFPRF